MATHKDYYHQESERLIYRKVALADLSSWAEFFVDNDRLKFLGTDENKSEKEAAEYWVNKQLTRYNDNEYGHLVAIDKASNHFIGMCGILIRNIHDTIEYEIGYSLKPKYWGKGYATEMAKTMKTYGFKNINTNRLISIIHVDNIDSIKVARKNGMSLLFKTKFMEMEVDIYGVNKVDEERKSNHKV